MKEIQREELSKLQERALRQVETALSRSHCPYSGLCVAAGLILENGDLITGVNYESASYGLTQCAERNAISRAQVEGRIQEASSLLLSACHLNDDQECPPLTPCGACRQWLVELCQRLDRDLVIYSFWKGSPRGLKGSARDLLPRAYQ